MQVYTVPMGVTRCYLIQDKGTVLVDGGPPNQLSSFRGFLRKAVIDPQQVSLIIQTHGHWDHIGSTRAIKELTGARIAMHSPDSEWLEKPLNQLPPAASRWGKVLLAVMSGYMRAARLKAAKVEVLLDDSEFSLVPFGIPGKVVFTPGHSAGSVSVVLDTGEAFVGDLAMNGLPFGFRPCLPVFAEDLKQVKASCKRLLEMGVKKVYPAHGKAFPAEVMRQWI